MMNKLFQFIFFIFYVRMLLDLEIFHWFSDLAWSHYFPKIFWKSFILIDTDIFLGKFSNLDWNWDLKKKILILAWWVKICLALPWYSVKLRQIFTYNFVLQINFFIGNYMLKIKKSRNHFWTKKTFSYKTLFYSKSLPYKCILR